MDHVELNRELGNIDIYLLDQILKGRIDKSDKILDAGCGEGRNISFFIKNGFNVVGIDKDESAIRLLKMYSRSLNPDIDTDSFIVGDSRELPFPNESFEYIISSAVLHFSENRNSFLEQTKELFRVLKSGGTLFLRSMVKEGVKDFKDLGDHLFELKDGSVRYLVDKKDLEYLENLGFDWAEDPKWVCVDSERSMSVFILIKN